MSKVIKLNKSIFDGITMDSDDTDHFYSVNFKLNEKEIRVNDLGITIRADFEKHYHISKEALLQIAKSFNIVENHIDDIEVIYE